MKLLKYIPLLIFVLPLTACGYKFAGGEHASLEPQYRKLYIDEVEHPTTLPWMEARLRSLLRDEFNRRSWVTWTTRNKATAWIKLNVQKYSRKASVTGDKDQTLRSTASITMTATIVSPADGRVLWSSGTISANWPYYGGEEEEADQEVTKRAIEILAERLSQNY